MNDFAFYFNLGWRHIISKDALDHQLFIVALSSVYLVHNWKELLVLVTAFTIGHSLTLALSTYGLLEVNTTWVEFFIPVTILIAAIINFFRKNFHPASYRLQYVLALLFGLVHGLGFANSIRFMLATDQQILRPLLGFNLGLEVGQLVVVLFVLGLSFLIVNKLSLQRKWWVWLLSAAALLWAAWLTIQNLPE